MLTIRNVWKMPKPPRPVCDHAQNRGLFNSVEQRFGEIIANGLGSLAASSACTANLGIFAGGSSSSCAGKSSWTRSKNASRYRVIYINWSDSIVTCSFHSNLILQASSTGTYGVWQGCSPMRKAPARVPQPDSVLPTDTQPDYTSVTNPSSSQLAFTVLAKGV